MRGLEQIPWAYDAGMHLLPGLQRWRKDLAAMARGKVLEVGCGTGWMFPLYPEGIELTGLDPNAASLHRARTRGPDAHLIVGTAEHLPFPDHHFDTVVSSLVFCSVPDPARGLAEIRRVLKPKGRLLMLEHVQATGKLGRWLLNRIQPAWTCVTGGCHPNRDTEAIVEAAGFRWDCGMPTGKGLIRLFFARP
ncbi:class I SAM-dependent methyltransferase [Wenzhouxiangella sp. XN79A]|uniref:class I SAM-dependent methyltransferase n=1 Tax=Wenzhouxiangella sp. XN79A TaxID=2724193 RepID=UPI00144ADC6D|nr:class I SAM-dependent methyltransferase [Wenzhouxiangella sp. XN79A]NKI36178.1 class I SAM-dependent methyltransferase [Wenzhouxiangella sp. XN79A]